MKRSPAFGMRPAHSASSPATVLERPSGSETPNRSSMASGETLPSVSKSAGPLVGEARTSSSCSSKISPTSSSSRSSSVAIRACRRTRPARRPGGGARAACRAAGRRSSAGRRHRQRTHRQRITGLKAKQVERVQHPDDVVERLAIDRDPAVAALGEDHADVVERRVLVDGDDIRARRHHLAHRPHAERHDAAHEEQLVVGPKTDRRALAPDRSQVGRPSGGPGGQQQAEDAGPEAEHRDDAVSHRLRAGLGQPSGHEVGRERAPAARRGWRG